MSSEIYFILSETRTIWVWVCTVKPTHTVTNRYTDIARFTSKQHKNNDVSVPIGMREKEMWACVCDLWTHTSYIAMCVFFLFILLSINKNPSSNVITLGCTRQCNFREIKMLKNVDNCLRCHSSTSTSWQLVKCCLHVPWGKGRFRVFKSIKHKILRSVCGIKITCWKRAHFTREATYKPFWCLQKGHCWFDFK